MNAPVLKINQGETRYEIYYDNDGFHNTFDSKLGFDFEDEADKQAYMDKFLKEELFAFGVVKLQPCKCCCEWSEKDSLWGIHAESPAEAFKQFIETIGQ